MKDITSITIVGGGSAAWLAAAYIRNNMWDVPLTVIDKEVGTPIGVGEATVLTFPSFMRECGLSTTDWFKEIDATYKSGINFPGWRKPGNTVWHPFYLNRSYIDKSITHYDVWCDLGKRDTFQEQALPSYTTNMNNKIDIHHAYTTLAYHIDCGKMVKRLQELCQNDITIIKSEVVKVVKDNEGYITELELANGQKHKGDFFIDCTGFASILKKQDRVELLGEGRLFTNTAVAGHVPYEDVEKERVPYVNCPAVDHGWIWKIPTQSRIGSGMVFNRDITDVDTAKQYFSDHWNGRIKPEDMKIIDWHPYYSKNFWEKNVVSIGLSGGFIEPLESTGLASMTEGVKHLANLIPQQWYDEKRIKVYNNYMMDWYDDAVDFINSHYADTEWDTTFWSWVKNTHVKSKKHLYYERWLKDPNRSFYSRVYSQTLFHPPNWQLWLIQMGYPTHSDLNRIPKLELEALQQGFDKDEHIRNIVSMPHSDAIETTNLGVIWYERFMSRHDRDSLV